MRGAAEHAHVGAELGDQDRDPPVDAGDVHQQRMLHVIGLQLYGKAFIERRNVLLGRASRRRNCKLGRKR